jgi:hypothetical protein
LTLNGRDFQILEKGIAICLGIEGEIPKEIVPKEEYQYVDGSSFDGQYSFGLEYDNDNGQPTLFIGRWIDSSELKLDDESLEW